MGNLADFQSWMPE